MKTHSLLVLALSGLMLHVVRAAPEEAKVDFATQIKPLITSRCINCHHSGALFGELNLENRAMAFKKRVNGPVILPGKPDSSAFYLVLKMPPKNPKAMPPNGHRIPDKDVNLIYDWIKQGAAWPKGADGVITPSRAVKE
jgi:mono/diheme cytochrome c family protein